MNHYAVYSDDPKDLIIIPNIKKYFTDLYPTCDWNIFSSNETAFASLNAASLPSFYIRFFTGSIIFCKLKDYITYKDQLMNGSYLIVQSMQEQEDVMEKQFSDLRLLMIEEDKIYEI